MLKEALYIAISIAAFGITHSIAASSQFKNKVMKLVGERIYEGWFRISYNAVSLITLAPIVYFLSESSSQLWIVKNITATAFTILQITGVVGILISMWQIDWIRFIGVRQLITYFIKEANVDEADTLVTTGLYKYTRHPLYFFSLLFIWFDPSMTISGFFFSIGITLYFVIGSYFEEKKMLKQFGNRYKNYRSNVAWLIPFIKLPKITVL